MTKLNVLEDLRTKEELINYFKEMGKNITEEELEELKKSYKQTEQNNGALSLQQLDDVAGGVEFLIKRTTGLNTRVHIAYNDDHKTSITVRISNNGVPTGETYIYPNNYFYHIKFFHNFPLLRDFAEDRYKEYNTNPLKFSLEYKESISSLHNSLHRATFCDDLFAYAINDHPYHESFKVLCDSHTCTPSLVDYLTSAQEIYNRNSCKVRRLLDISARCVKGISVCENRQLSGVGGWTDLDANITLNADSASSYTLFHEMGHCLDRMSGASEHLGCKISGFKPNYSLYNFFVASAITEMHIEGHDKQARLHIITSQVLSLLPKRDFDSAGIFPCDEENLGAGDRSAEIIARLFEIYSYTNGTWEIPAAALEMEAAKRCILPFLEVHFITHSSGKAHTEYDLEKTATDIVAKSFNLRQYLPELVVPFEAEMDKILSMAKPISLLVEPRQVESPKMPKLCVGKTEGELFQFRDLYFVLNDGHVDCMHNVTGLQLKTSIDAFVAFIKDESNIDMLARRIMWKIKSSVLGDGVLCDEICRSFSDLSGLRTRTTSLDNEDYIKLIKHYIVEPIRDQIINGTMKL